jgi:RNA polymerase sigma factor (sigma-70 family)
VRQPAKDAFTKGLASEDLYLVTAMADQNERAWDLFRQRCLPLVAAACRQIGIPEVEHDEVEADVLFDLFAQGALARYNGTGPLEAWTRALCRVAALRRRAALRRSTLMPVKTVAVAADPGDAVILAEQIAALRGALARLPRREREALHLRFFDEQKLAAIAERIGMRYPTQAARIIASGTVRLRLLLVEPQSQGARRAQVAAGRCSGSAGFHCGTGPNFRQSRQGVSVT